MAKVVHESFNYLYERIAKNSIRCKHCFSVIESTHRNDFKFCNCKKVAVNGGDAYLKRVYDSKDDFDEMSEIVPVSKQKMEAIIGQLRAERRSSKIYSDSYYNAAIAAGQYYLDKYYPSAHAPVAGGGEVGDFGF